MATGQRHFRNSEVFPGITQSAADAKQEIADLFATQEFANLDYSFTSDLSENIKEDYGTLANS